MPRPKQPRSLNKRLLTLIILCWIVPIAVFFLFTTIFYQNGIVQKTEGLMEKQLVNAASFASIRIEDAIVLCQKPSYEKTWENAWRKFKNGKYSWREYLLEVNTSLKGKFYLDERFNMYAFYGEDFVSTENVPECFSSRTGISFRSYVDEIQPSLQDFMQSDSSYAHVQIVDERIFIVRNLYTTSDYQRYGTLVVELNKNKVFQDVEPDIRKNMVVCINDGTDRLDFGASGHMNEKCSALMEKLWKKYDGHSTDFHKTRNLTYNAYLYQSKTDNYHMGIMVLANRFEMYWVLYEFYFILIAMLALFAPIVYYVLHFLHKQIEIPIERMMNASKRVAEGEIGATVDGGQMPNQEFEYLMNSFDGMSKQVKDLFECIYDEKLARKDAQIQALQAQINPHFLNNTLEMINWQARLNGDAVISKMIESLGTVLNYRINRSNVKEIHLAEELQCTDAYFYIMSIRFGQRLKIEKEIDESLLYIMVPPLILQPIVENAIVHGVEVVKNGVISLCIYHDRESVYLEVRNTGKKMTDEEKNRIQAMLDGDDSQIPKKEGHHTSIGIQNVNKRVKLVYGEEYGLTIEQNEEMVTITKIRLPYYIEETVSIPNIQSKKEQEESNMARLNK